MKFISKIIIDLLQAFPESFINHNGEFIASGTGKYASANSYFNLNTCENTDDIRCKVLEFLSRDASYSMPFGNRKNKTFHAFMLKGINDFLCTNFSEEDMELIYEELGNRVNHDLTMDFLYSGYDMEVLKRRKND